jgi:serine/threonine-protein kinase
MSTDSDDTQTISQLLAKTFKAVRIDQRTESGNSPTDSLGRYRITGQLGAGGMGEVFQVHDSDLGRQIAAKVIRGQTDPVMLAKFVREAQITGQLGHPNIVPVHELGLTPDQKIYFTMKQVEGQTLAQMLTDQLNIEGCHPIRTASETSQSEVLTTERCHTSLIAFLHHFLKVCDALAFAHSRGVIHRDLKPSNIMIGQFGEVQVMDWGLARVVGQPDPAQSDCTLDLGGGGSRRWHSARERASH